MPVIISCTSASRLCPWDRLGHTGPWVALDSGNRSSVALLGSKRLLRLQRCLSSSGGSTAYSSPFQPIPAYSSQFKPIPANLSLFKPIQTYSSILQPIPVYSSLFQPIPAYFILFQPIPAYVSLFQPIQAYSSLF